MSTGTSASPAPPKPAPSGPLAAVDGYKTYIAAAGLAVTALIQGLVQHDWTSALQSLMAALGALGIRHAIAKSSPATAKTS